MLEANGVGEILLVEDNATDAELCIRALKKNNLANRLVWVKDGAEALDFLFAKGAYAGRGAGRGFFAKARSCGGAGAPPHDPGQLALENFAASSEPVVALPAL